MVRIGEVKLLTVVVEFVDWHEERVSWNKKGLFCLGAKLVLLAPWRDS